MEVGTSTTSQGRSCLEVHILDRIPHLGFNVALQHPCPKEIYPSPSSATPDCLFLKSQNVTCGHVPCTFTELRPEWWRPAFILCCGKGKHTPEKRLCCATETAQQQKFFWKPRIYCSAAFILFFRYMPEGNMDHRFLHPNAWSHRMPNCAFWFFS